MVPNPTLPVCRLRWQTGRVGDARSLFATPSLSTTPPKSPIMSPCRMRREWHDRWMDVPP